MVGIRLTYIEWKIVNIDIVRKEAQDRPLPDVIFQASQPTLFFTTSSEGKALVLRKIHDH